MNKLLIILYTGMLLHVEGNAQHTSHYNWKRVQDLYNKGDYIQVIDLLEEQHYKNKPYSKKAYSYKILCYYMLNDIQHVCSSINESRRNGYRVTPTIYKHFCNDEWKIRMNKNFSYPNTDIYPELNYRPRYSRADTLRGALRLERTCYDVYFYDLQVRINPLSKYIEGKNTIFFQLKKPSESIQVDLFNNLSVAEIQMDGQPLNYKREYDAIFIDLPKKLDVGNNYSVSVTYSGKPVKATNPPWSGGFVWNRDSRLNRWASVSCEQLGASSWWPVKDHLSDRPDSMLIHIEVPGKYKGISNGSYRGASNLTNNYTQYNWFVSYPINSYNVTFYMGKYTSFEDTIGTNGIPLQAWYHVLEKNIDIARNHFKQVQEIIPFFASAFGPFPFPKDKLRLVESPYTGMEHQTAIAIGHSYNNNKNSEGYVNRNYDQVIVHELAHEWWGNSLTITDMADAWIHEGFATYAELLFIEDRLGYDASIKEIAHQVSNIQNIWPLVQNRDVNEDSFAGQDIYYKGALLLHSLRITINNDTLFRNMIRDFHNQYRYSIINSDVFIKYVTDYTKQDLAPLINSFLFQTQLPVLAYSYNKENGDLILKYKWTRVEPGFYMPFSIETLGNNKTYRLEASTEAKEIILKNTDSFRFINDKSNLENCPHNGFSYYYTLKLQNN